MFTQLVMISTIFLLTLTGIKMFQRSKEVDYFTGKIMGFGLFFIAIGILFYVIRDILVQSEMYQIQEKLLIIGGIFQILGNALMLWFFCGEFISKRLAKLSFLAGLLLIILMVIAMQLIPLGSELILAPFEPFPYTVIRNFLQAEVVLIPGLALFFWLIISPALLAGIILFNTLKVKEKERRKKGFLYGLGFLFLFVPMVICIFISPIYARWGYLIGAILLHQAFKVKN